MIPVPVTVQQSSWNARLGRHSPQLDESLSLSNISTASHQFQRQHLSVASSTVLMQLLPKSLGYAWISTHRSSLTNLIYLFAHLIGYLLTEYRGIYFGIPPITTVVRQAACNATRSDANRLNKMHHHVECMMHQRTGPHSGAVPHFRTLKIF